MKQARVLIPAFTILSLTGGTPPTYAQDIIVRVDPRVELVSILFQMAGRDEYNMTRVSAWQKSVQQHFQPYANHPAVLMTARLAGQFDIGFFVPMNLAVHLSDPPELAERTPFEAAGSLHQTWTVFPDSTSVYLDLLRRFAEDTGYDKFLAQNSAILDTTEARIRRVVEQELDLDWFRNFWGVEQAQEFLLVPGLVNGRASYGVEYQPPTGPTELYAIVGVTAVDGVGLPTFDEDFAFLIAHEFNHSYANGLIEAHLEEFSEFADSLYAPVEQMMRRQAYGSWESMLYESLVRAAVARYRLSHGGEAEAAAEIEEQVEAGFVWTGELYELLGQYEGERESYPSMAQFMDRVVGFFREFAPGVRGRVEQ